MQREDGGYFAVDSFTTDSGLGALERKRFSVINGLAAVGFLLFGAVELLTLVAGHAHSSADTLQAVVIAALSFSLCALALKLTPQL